ncbi:MAG: hypothetical protein WKF80_05130 [Thermomicrobiales bacterium]
MSSAGEFLPDREIAIGVEDIEPGRWVAWVFAIPGCFGAGPTEAEAVADVSRSIRQETGREPFRSITVVEHWRAMVSQEDPDYLVNACFDDDYRPLSAGEVANGIARLTANRAALTDTLVTRPMMGEVARITTHLATAERWYLGQLGLDAPVLGPDVIPMHRLAVVRDALLAALPALVGVELSTVDSGETWTPRKLLRRAVWHERDHTAQITALPYRA